MLRQSSFTPDHRIKAYVRIGILPLDMFVWTYTFSTFPYFSQSTRLSPVYTFGACTRLSPVHDCRLYTIVACTRLSPVHDCRLYTIVACTRLSPVHDCRLYTIVACTRLSPVHVCRLYTFVPCTRLFGSQGDNTTHLQLLNRYYVSMTTPIVSSVVTTVWLLSCC